MSDYEDREETGLRQVKTERRESKGDISYEYLDSDSEDRFGTLSSQPLPQQFFQDLDTAVTNLPRKEYVQTIITHCGRDYGKIDAYRQRLADRARAIEGCPMTSLVHRRNSTHASKVVKYANDCYTINAYMKGEQSRDFDSLFTCQSQNETVIKEQDSLCEEYVATKLTSQAMIPTPDLMAMLVSLKTEVHEIAVRQDRDSTLLADIKNGLTEMAANYRLIHGTVRSILSRCSDSAVSTQVDKLDGEVQRLGVSIATVNKRLVEGATGRSPPGTGGSAKQSAQQTRGSTGATTETTGEPIQLAGEDANELSAAITVRDVEPGIRRSACVKTYAEASKPQEPQREITIREEPNNTEQTASRSTSLSASATQRQQGTSSSDRRRAATDSARASKNPNRHTQLRPADEVAPKAAAGRFISARKRRNVSYFLGNIDSTVTEADICDFLKENSVHVSAIRVFKGKYGSSAKLNIPQDHVKVINSDDFWPDGVTCRKWVAKEQYDRDRQRIRERRRGDDDRYDYGAYRDNEQYEDEHRYYSNRYRDSDSYNRTNRRDHSPWDNRENDWWDNVSVS